MTEAIRPYLSILGLLECEPLSRAKSNPVRQMFASHGSATLTARIPQACARPYPLLYAHLCILSHCALER
jgi:hypothetical protein